MVSTFVLPTTKYLTNTYETVSTYASHVPHYTKASIWVVKKNALEASRTASTYVANTYTLLYIQSKNNLEKNRPIIIETIEKVRYISSVAIKISAALVLFLSNSSLFTFGAVYFYLDKNKVKQVFADIHKDWEKSSHLSAAAKAIVISGAIIAWPATLAIGSFLMGAYAAMTWHNHMDADTATHSSALLQDSSSVVPLPQPIQSQQRETVMTHSSTVRTIDVLSEQNREKEYNDLKQVFAYFAPSSSC